MDTDDGPCLGSAADFPANGCPVASTVSLIRSPSVNILLILLCGKSDASTGLHRLGLQCHEFDATLGSHLDISDDAVWQPLSADIRSGRYCGLMAVLPADTFAPGGGASEAPAVRGSSGSSRYGLRDIPQESKALLRLHNLLIQRVATSLRILLSQGKTVCCAAAASHQGSITAFGLDDFFDVLKAPGVKLADSVMCAFDRNFPARRVTWLYCGCDLSRLPASCTHKILKWRCRSSDTVLYARHRPRHDTHNFLLETEIAGVVDAPLLPSYLLCYYGSYVRLLLLVFMLLHAPLHLQHL